jgi:hypothetical protein
MIEQFSIGRVEGCSQKQRGWPRFSTQISQSGQGELSKKDASLGHMLLAHRIRCEVRAVPSRTFGAGDGKASIKNQVRTDCPPKPRREVDGIHRDEPLQRKAILSVTLLWSFFGCEDHRPASQAGNVVAYGTLFFQPPQIRASEITTSCKR